MSGAVWCLQHKGSEALDLLCTATQSYLHPAEHIMLSCQHPALASTHLIATDCCVLMMDERYPRYPVCVALSLHSCMLSFKVYWLGVVANLVLWSPLSLLSSSFLSPPLPFSPLLSATFSSPLLSGGSNFNHFPENQLNTDFAFLCKPAWGTLLYHRSPLSWYHLVERRSFTKYLVPRVPPLTTPLLIREM